uniref:Uncharacterized protein n=1 Tax=Arundo donax TaxID=35708 RepID=A0A0A9B5Q7_ARUDO
MHHGQHRGKSSTYYCEPSYYCTVQSHKSLAQYCRQKKV